MINIKKTLIAMEPSLWNRIKIKMNSYPKYACSNISDFIENKKAGNIDIGETVLLSSLEYVPLNKKDREDLGIKEIPIELTDGMQKIEVYLTPTAANLISGRFLSDILKENWMGMTLYNPVLLNGFPKGSWAIDYRVYLRSFENSGPSKEDYSTSFSRSFSGMLLPSQVKVPVFSNN